MYDLATIKAMNREASRRSSKTGILPVLMTADRLHAFQVNPSRPGFTIPFIGNRRPRGYKLKRELFVDTSGFGSPGESALTLEQLTQTVKVGFAYALIECGQFQAYLGEFTPPRRVTANQEEVDEM